VFDDGIKALSSMRNDSFTFDGERASVLKAALAHVTSETQLEIVIKFLGNYRHDQEARLLVEKAIVLIEK